MPAKAMLMTAGLGTRLRPFSEFTPKPLTPILGVPCSAFALDALSRVGVQSVVANLHYLPGKTREGLTRLDWQLQYSDESNLLLGSAGGLKKALPLLNSFEGPPSFYVLNADTVCSLDLRELAETHARLRRDSGVTMTLALLSRDEANKGSYREVLVDASGDFITGLGERTEFGKMYVGIAILEPEALHAVPDGVPADFVETILMPAVRSKKVGAHHFSGLWMDVGSPELWRDTHLEFMNLAQTASLPIGWQRLIEQESKSIGPLIWVSRNCDINSAPPGWVGPCFWDGVGTQPTHLGPRAILYGGAPTLLDPVDGIGASGHWIKL